MVNSKLVLMTDTL